MNYVLYKPHGSDEPWLELPGFRSAKDAKVAVKTLVAETKEDGSRAVDVKLCVGKGRNRRDLLRL